MSAINPGSSLPAQRADGVSLRRLYLARGAVALVWAITFAVVRSGLDAGTVTLLLIYPAIDVAASLYDASTSSGEPRTIQRVNAGISAAALVAVALASRDSTSTVLHVFGVWATVSGLVQLVVAVRRRATVGWQWAMLVSGGLSTIAGLTFNVQAAGSSPKLSVLSGYAGLGAVLFLVSALLIRTAAIASSGPSTRSPG
jgi:uncharacterized membrane protein HdeD (DUF308 family)